MGQVTLPLGEIQFGDAAKTTLNVFLVVVVQGGNQFAHGQAAERTVVGQGFVDTDLVFTQQLGTGKLIEASERYGFDTSDFAPDLSLALGTQAMSPMEVATGYAILANGGYQVTNCWRCFLFTTRLLRLPLVSPLVYNLSGGSAPDFYLFFSISALTGRTNLSNPN